MRRPVGRCPGAGRPGAGRASSTGSDPASSSFGHGRGIYRGNPTGSGSAPVTGSLAARHLLVLRPVERECARVLRRVWGIRHSRELLGSTPDAGSSGAWHLHTVDTRILWPI